MAGELALAAWREHLENRGHRITEPTEKTVNGFSLWPDPGTIVTVAVAPDPTLYPQYRQRFFLLGIEPEPVFRLLGCPEPHRLRWLDLLPEGPPGSWQDFLAGPGSWLLSRLARFTRIVAWLNLRPPWAVPDNTTPPNWGLELPAKMAPFFAADGPEAWHPCLVSVADGRFPDAVAACVLCALDGRWDSYLADEAGAEVYLVHHHEKVVVSIPESRARKNLLGEFEEAAWLFRDVSGYGSSIDEEDEGQA